MTREQMADRLFAGFLRTWRNYSHQSLSEVSRASGLHVNRLRQLEMGLVRKPVNSREVLGLSLALGVPEADLRAQAVF